ncbi:MAG: MBL fold metallo-hydrolase [Deltaproteobacteria bacterium]|nr:MAG: MBL fold metallo-hydrolase [Deltaproteobacteria bacterium]
MKTWIALALCAASCMNGRSKTSSDAMDRVDRGLAALGGADKVSSLQALTVKGTARHWEPEQSVKAGGEMRLASDSTFVAQRDLANEAARTEWDRKFVYPSPREYKFTEIVTKKAGYVEGIDSTGRTKKDQEANPPRHAMSGVRLAAAQRELERSSPRLFAEMKAHPGEVFADEMANGDKRIPAVRYKADDTTFLVAFDDSGLPSRIRTLDADSIYGDSTYDLVLSDYRDVSGVKFPYRQSYELNGKEVIHIEVEEARAEAPQAKLEVPADLQAPSPARGNVPYQWVIRRQFIGTYLDSDAITHDGQAVPGLKLAEVAPGVGLISGGSHNSLVVEMADHLVVFDAPVGEIQSRFTLDTLKAKYPSKPVKLLVLTHHHMDHAGGARTFVAQGASVLVGQGNAAHFEKMFAAPHKIDGDALEKSPRKASIEEVADHKIIDDGKRKVEILRIDNPHADGMLIAYIPDAKLGYVVDIWSPGRDKLGDKATPGQQALVAAVAKLSSTPERFAGGHGTVADYAPLASLAGAQPRAER